jgi:hypothetical protein
MSSVPFWSYSLPFSRISRKAPLPLVPLISPGDRVAQAQQVGARFRQEYVGRIELADRRQRRGLVGGDDVADIVGRLVDDAVEGRVDLV